MFEVTNCWVLFVLFLNFYYCLSSSTLWLAMDDLSCKSDCVFLSVFISQIDGTRRASSVLSTEKEKKVDLCSFKWLPVVGVVGLRTLLAPIKVRLHCAQTRRRPQDESVDLFVWSLLLLLLSSSWCWWNLNSCESRRVDVLVSGGVTWWFLSLLMITQN